MDEKIIIESGKIMREMLREAREQMEKEAREQMEKEAMNKEDVISLLETLKSALESEYFNKRIVVALDYAIDAVRYSKTVKFIYEKD